MRLGVVLVGPGSEPVGYDAASVWVMSKLS